MPTLHWIGKDKVINHHLDVPYKVLEHQYRFGKVGLSGLQDFEAAKNQEFTNSENPNPDNEVFEFEKAGLTGSQDLDAVEIQLSTHLKNSRSDNKIIHGDNLEALKSLLPEYEGKIKCIYIDPPYNTGNESWVYNDNVNDPKIKKWLGQVVGKEAEDLTRHDKWLCMMYPRLKLLHKLLADDGAIFISIDDNEQANLKLMMDEIWGNENFVASVIWHKMDSPKNSALYLSEDHEYITVYSKSKKVWRPIKLPRTDEMKARYKNPDNDSRGVWLLGDLAARNFYAQGIYPITTKKGRIIEGPPAGSYWRISRDKLDELDKDNRIWWGKDGDNRPGIKRFLTDVQDGVVPQTLWGWKDVGSTRHSKQELSKIMEAKANDQLFITPKPRTLIERVLQISTDKNSIILDSFAGSGTTAHAVLHLNKQDSGNRKFILIEMEAYAETITAERIKRVINGYGNTEGTGGSFDFYTLGEPLFLEDGLLNENLPLQKNREYIWYTETNMNYEKGAESKEFREKNGDLKSGSVMADKNGVTALGFSSPLSAQASFLGKNQNTAYYFYYLPQEITTLDHDFLVAISIKAEQYIIYADNCLLTPKYMAKNSIIFKKIPRDITKF